MTISHHIHPRQLLFVELIQRQLDRADGVEQIAVALQTSLGGDGGVLCADGSVAGPALMGAPVRASGVGRSTLRIHQEIIPLNKFLLYFDLLRLWTGGFGWIVRGTWATSSRRTFYRWSI